MITYREATIDDSDQIARLHAVSWQQNYSGIWRDEFLNGDLLSNRSTVWKNRLTQPAKNQYVIVAESENAICGFACAYADDDPVWGTLLDNLHVYKDLKGQGIGSHLLNSAALWAYNRASHAGFYLWVLEQNTSARRFYETLGATNYELITTENPGGGLSPTCRYVWPDIKKLIE